MPEFPDDFDAAEWLEARAEDEYALDAARWQRWVTQTYQPMPLMPEQVERITESLPVDVRMSLVAFRAALAGGYVRDLLGRARPADIDLFMMSQSAARMLAHLLAMSRGVRPRRDVSYLLPRASGESFADRVREHIQRNQLGIGAGIPLVDPVGTFLVPGPLPVHLVGTTDEHGHYRNELPRTVTIPWLRGLFAGFDISAGAAAVYWNAASSIPGYQGVAIPNVEYDIRHRNLRYLRIGLRRDIRSGRLQRLLERTVRLLDAGWSLRPGEVSALTRAIESAHPEELAPREAELLRYIREQRQRRDAEILAALTLIPPVQAGEPQPAPAPTETIQPYARTQRNLSRPMDLSASQLGLPPEGRLDLHTMDRQGWAVALRALIALTHDVLVYLLPYRVWLDADRARRDPHMPVEIHEGRRLRQLEMRLGEAREQGVAPLTLPAPPSEHMWSQLAARLEQWHARERWHPGEEGVSESGDYRALRDSLRQTMPAAWSFVMQRLVQLDARVADPAHPERKPSVAEANQVINGLAMQLVQMSGDDSHAVAQTLDAVNRWLTMVWFTQIQLAMPVRIGSPGEKPSAAPGSTRKKRPRGRGNVSGRR